MARHDLFIKIFLPEITHNPTIQLIDSLIRARIVKTFLESNPSLENFSWLRMNKIGRDGATIFQMGLTGAPWKILPAVVNFGKFVKFWEQLLDWPVAAIRISRHLCVAQLNGQKSCFFLQCSVL